MELPKLIIKIEKTKRKLYKTSVINPDKLLKVSRELDILINKYYILKGKCVFSSHNYCEFVTLHNQGQLNSPN